MSHKGKSLISCGLIFGRGPGQFQDLDGLTPGVGENALGGGLVSAIPAGAPAVLLGDHHEWLAQLLSSDSLVHRKHWADSPVTGVYQMWEFGGSVFSMNGSLALLE